MSLRSDLANIATRLIDKFGDDVGSVTVTVVPGFDEFTVPTTQRSRVDIKAVVTGADRWADGNTILMGDLAVLVSGEAVQADVGGVVVIDGIDHRIVQKQKILAAGIASAVRYIVRR